MMRGDSRNGLRKALLLDAGASAGMGAMLAALAGPLEGVLGLPDALLRGAGLALLPFAASLAYLATRPHPGRGATGAVVAVNALWVADSLILLMAGWVSPTPLGTAFVLAQAAVVALFAVLQYRAIPPARQLAEAR
ncbi:MAG TPA: hypothetical protein VEY30_04675 [Myxococcaceae bacterium]|nr:hypothetical protein [Myxococcaceae bacterium]